MVVLLVALAAGVGAVGRSALHHALQGRFALATLVVNVTGAFVLGWSAGALSGTAAHVVGAGLCGGWTTLSTLAWESLVLVEEGRPRAALLNALGSTALGLVAAALGLAAA